MQQGVLLVSAALRVFAHSINKYLSYTKGFSLCQVLVIQQGTGEQNIALFCSPVGRQIISWMERQIERS